MAEILGPMKVQRYRVEFKFKAVKLSQIQGVHMEAASEAHSAQAPRGAIPNLRSGLTRRDARHCAF